MSSSEEHKTLPHDHRQTKREISRCPAGEAFLLPTAEEYKKGMRCQTEQNSPMRFTLADKTISRQSRCPGNYMKMRQRQSRLEWLEAI